MITNCNNCRDKKHSKLGKNLAVITYNNLSTKAFDCSKGLNNELGIHSKVINLLSKVIKKLSRSYSSIRHTVHGCSKYVIEP